MTDLLKIAHRGASKYLFENSIESFNQAIEWHADMIETDIRQTKDSQLVIYHDPDLRKLIPKEKGKEKGKDIKIENLTLKELKQYPLPTGSTILTLEEAFDQINGRCPLKLDIKVRGVEKELIRILNKYDLTDTTIITSDLHDIITSIHEIDPTIKKEAIFKPKIKSLTARQIVEKAQKLNIQILAPHHYLVSEKLINLCHENGFHIHIWTINKPKHAEKLIEWGTDGITTDDLKIFDDLKE